MKTFPILSYSKVLGEEKCYMFSFPNKIKITNQDRLKSKSKYNFLFWDCQRESNFYFPKLFKFSLNSNCIEGRSKTGLFKCSQKVWCLFSVIQPSNYTKSRCLVGIDKIWPKCPCSMAGAIRKFWARSVILATPNQHLTNSQ